MKRLDKILADAGMGTRSEIKNAVRQSRVRVDGEVCGDCGARIDEISASVTMDGIPVRTDTYYYIMMNKPASVVSAVLDSTEKTVIDILPREYIGLELFPVGRLDKDTQGLLLLTNDGAWAHSITAPSRHVEKVYIAGTDKRVTGGDIAAFESGVILRDGTRCLPAVLEDLCTENEPSCRIILTEGKYHQVKRMLASRGIKVLNLKRVRLGALCLDANLMPGAVRELTVEEKNIISSNV